jgi:hypothetical protein
MPSTPAPSPTWCAAICCRLAMWPRRASANCGACCAIAALVVSEAVRMKNKMAGLLMETGALYVKEKLHGKKYFASLLEELEEVPESVIDLLRLSRGALEMFESTQRKLVRELLADPELTQRVERLMTIPAVGEITALTWALGDRRPAALSLRLPRP